MSVGFATNLDVDLSLTVDDSEPCMIDNCGREAVILGIIATPCNCPQPLCLLHYLGEKPKWAPGDVIWCHLCVKTEHNAGKFIRWEKA